MKKIYIVQLEDTMNSDGWLTCFSNSSQAEQYYYEQLYIFENFWLEDKDDLDSNEKIDEKEYKRRHCSSGRNGQTIYFKTVSLNDYVQHELY